MPRPLKEIRRNTPLALIFPLLMPFAALAAPLNEAEALRLGLGRPELADIFRAHAGEAEAEVLEARTWANPTLELSRDKTGAARETAWQLSQPVDFSGRRGLRQEAANFRSDATAAENQARRNERAAELRRAFHQLLRQQETLRAVERWAGRFAVVGGVVDKLARAGEASGYDRRRLLREQHAADARVAEARADLERGRAALGALIGKTIDSGEEEGEGVSGRLLPDQPADLAMLQTRLDARPDLAALRARAEAANADNSAARRNFPEVTFGIGGKQVDEDGRRETGTMFSLSLPLPIFERQQAGDRRSAAQAMAARAEYSLARQKAEGDLLGLHRQVTRLTAAAERYRRDAVVPSADLLRIAEAAYHAGESTVLELLDAYKGALEAESTALDLEWKARDAGIELDQLTGSHPL